MVSCGRFAQVSSSDDEEDSLAKTRSQGQNSRRPEETMEGKMMKREKVSLNEESDGEEEETERKRKKDDEETPPEELEPDDAKPVGEPVKVTGRGTHYWQFEYGGNRYELEDSVLLHPEDNSLEPYVAIIKDITKKQDGRMMILGQWFYRQEDAKKTDGGNWVVNDTHELFYSFHRDEVPAESVIERCVVNFVPAHKQLPRGTGFIVREVYDTVAKKLWKLTDIDYAVAKQREIDLFVDKSLARLGDLPDL
uniref:BAH domain-containing protein n=1 Tax=Brassica campestris TaxID=3711 RepID=A0A3P5Y0R5_BRACM|nr:unnamed protein product [Brassica rapa]